MPLPAPDPAGRKRARQARTPTPPWSPGASWNREAASDGQSLRGPQPGREAASLRASEALSSRIQLSHTAKLFTAALTLLEAK